MRPKSLRLLLAHLPLTALCVVQAELNEYKQANSDFEAMVQRQRNAAAGKEPAPAAEADEADRLRAELRRDLARKLKQDLLAKSQG